MKSQKFDIKGMTCSACSNAVDRSVKKLQGVKELNVNLLSNSMIIKYDENLLNDEEIIKTVENTGYEASLQDSKKVQKNGTKTKYGSKIRCFNS